MLKYQDLVPGGLRLFSWFWQLQLRVVVHKISNGY